MSLSNIKDKVTTCQYTVPQQGSTSDVRTNLKANNLFYYHNTSSPTIRLRLNINRLFYSIFLQLIVTSLY